MNKRKVAVLDFGIGNVKSISNAIERLGAFPVLTNNEKEILSSDRLILPGVGAFAKGMSNLKERGLVSIIQEFVKTNRPFLGICLGMQMLLDESEEFGVSKGLGIIKGKVIKMLHEPIGNERLPNVGWSEIIEPRYGKWENTILHSTPVATDVYFVHTFVASPDNDEDILATAKFSNKTFCAAVKKGNVYGTQFHPEKSGKYGLEILKNFIEL